MKLKQRFRRENFKKQKQIWFFKKTNKSTARLSKKKKRRGHNIDVAEVKKIRDYHEELYETIFENLEEMDNF